MKWTSWASPIKKVIAGSYRLNYLGKEKEIVDISFSTSSCACVDRAVVAAPPTKSADSTYVLRIEPDKVSYQYSKAQVRNVNFKVG